MAEKSLITVAARIEWKQAERSDLADEWSHKKGRELNPALLDVAIYDSPRPARTPHELFYFRRLRLFNFGADEVVQV